MVARTRTGLEAMSAADLDVVIATRERWGVLERTLSALRGQTVTGFRTIIVCDGTDQDVPPRLRRSVVSVPGPGAGRAGGGPQPWRRRERGTARAVAR